MYVVVGTVSDNYAVTCTTDEGPREELGTDACIDSGTDVGISITGVRVSMDGDTVPQTYTWMLFNLVGLRVELFTEIFTDPGIIIAVFGLGWEWVWTSERGPGPCSRLAGWGGSEKGRQEDSSILISVAIAPAIVGT